MQNDRQRRLDNSHRIIKGPVSSDKWMTMPLGFMQRPIGTVVAIRVTLGPGQSVRLQFVCNDFVMTKFVNQGQAKRTFAYHEVMTSDGPAMMVDSIEIDGKSFDFL